MRALAETKEQFAALLETEAALIYIDCGYFSAAEWKDCADAAHAAGKLCALRLPHIFRKAAAEYLSGRREALFAAGFDAWLLRSLEEVLWLSETGLVPKALIADHNLYAFNRRSAALLFRIFSEEAGEGALFQSTLPLELTERELQKLRKERTAGEQGKTCGFCKEAPERAEAFGRTEKAEEGGTARILPPELLVYGRAPMMVSAQCIRKTALGCDKKPCVMQLRDRTGAKLPVKNNCAFCYNTILNAHPTVLYDLNEAVAALAPGSVRYEFTTESGKEVKEILSGKRIYKENEFTRGHFRKGIA